MTTRMWGAAAALLLLPGVAGCGSAQEGAVADAAVAFDAAVQASDYQGACELLAPPTAAALAEQEGSCARGLETAELPPEGPIAEVAVYSGSAQVKTQSAAMFLVVDGGQWRVLAAGCQQEGTEVPYECLVSKG